MTSILDYPVGPRWGQNDQGCGGQSGMWPGAPTSEVGRDPWPSCTASTESSVLRATARTLHPDVGPSPTPITGTKPRCVCGPGILPAVQDGTTHLHFGLPGVKAVTRDGRIPGLG